MKGYLITAAIALVIVVAAFKVKALNTWLNKA